MAVDERRHGRSPLALPVRAVTTIVAPTPDDSGHRPPQICGGSVSQLQQGVERLRVCLFDAVEKDRRGTSAPVCSGTSDWSKLAVAQVLELVDDMAVGIP
jgi:hypothetical protein